jgi:hypothetical protein
MRYRIDQIVDPVILPDFPLYDLSEDEEKQNLAYCQDLQRRLLEYEMNPRNFFKIGRGTKYLR